MDETSLDQTAATTKMVEPYDMFSLFFRPGRFFASQNVYNSDSYAIMALLCYSITRSIDRIDKEIARDSFGVRRSALDTLEQIGLFDSWAVFWVIVVVVGAIGAPFIWWLGGWWYGLRVRWSGVTAPDMRSVRLIYTYSALVQSLPMLLMTLASTFLYANYAEDYASDSPVALIILIFPFWALITSYVGVRTSFPVSRWKALFWFLIGPLLLYLFGFVALVAGLLMME